jgi:DNA-binding CsgD family transcriptional regulator
MDYGRKDCMGGGRILGISEQTAVRHLHNATNKLVNKHQAVLKAVRVGYIN